MKIGFIGMGKLGIPVATAMASRGHVVRGYDIGDFNLDDRAASIQEAGPDGVGSLLPHWKTVRSNFRMERGSLAEVCDHAEIIFVAVQTPHELRFEGITPLPEDRADFDYAMLRNAVRRLRKHITRPVPVCIISTVLPGTMARDIAPLFDDRMTLVYNPSFIAMGTAMHDFIHCEMVLTGARSAETPDVVKRFYASITDAPIIETTIITAELIKVAYNTYIGQKIVFANTMMEICHKTGARVDDVTQAMRMAHMRVNSGAYLEGGMGDGGACHPRDNIAMSWLARQLDLSCDWFEEIMVARESQAQWIAQLCENLSENYRRPIHILGYAYKPESDLTYGSSALLVENVLRGWGAVVTKSDPYVDALPAQSYPGVFLIGVRHARFATHTFPPGSVVVDPFRYIPHPPSEEYSVIRLGEGKRHDR